MKVLKGILTYVLILIGVLAIAGILLFSAMTFLDFSVFGYRVAMSSRIRSLNESSHVTLNETNGYNADTDSEDPNFMPENTKRLEIHTNNYNLEITAMKTSMVEYVKYFGLERKDNAFGLVSNGSKLQDSDGKSGGVFSYWRISYYDKVDSDQPMTNPDDYPNASKIVINLITPQGALNYRDSYLRVYLPIHLNYQLDLYTGKGDIDIYPYLENGVEETGKLSISSLKVTTTSGDMTFHGLKENEPALEGETTYVELSALELKTNRGTFNLNQQNIRLVNSGVAKIDSVRGNFAFKEIQVGFTIKGDNLVIEADKVVTNNKKFSYNCPNGTLKIGEIDCGSSITEIITEYAKVNIQKVVGDISIQATYGDTFLKDTLANVVDVTTTHGNITINNVGHDNDHTGVVAVRSTYGDINVSYSANGWFTTNNGNMTLTHTGDSKEAETIIETSRGSVNAKGLRGKVTATATGSANMTLTYAAIDEYDSGYSAGKNSSNITVANGKLTINVYTPFASSTPNKGFDTKVTLSGNATFAFYTDDVLNDGTRTTSAGTHTYDNYKNNNNYAFDITSKGGDVKFNISQTIPATNA